MTKSLNHVTLIGHLCKDPDLKTTSSGIAVASFSLATNDRYKDATGELVETVEFHNITAWRGLAGIVGKYLRKGSKCYVAGKLKTEKYEKDGVSKSATKIIAEDLIMLDGAPAVEQHVETTSQPAARKGVVKGRPVTKPQPSTDDLPF